MPWETCPDPELLLAFVHGRLAETKIAEIAAHAVVCKTCETRLEELETREDAFEAELRDAGRLGDLSAFLQREPETEATVRADFIKASSGTDVTQSTAKEDSAEAPTDSTGDIVAVEPGQYVGRYRILSILGSGGFGTVYLGQDPELGRKVAIKVPNPERLRRPESVRQYLREAQVLASLDHAHIVQVFDVGRLDNGGCYIVTKFVEGKTLADLLAATDYEPDFEAAVSILIAVADGLAHAHDRQLIHRDIKSSNILLGQGRHPYLADFGLALHATAVRENGSLAGTPVYMSPEQARGENHRIDLRSDIYSLGVVFYELLAGRRPYQGHDTISTLRKILGAQVIPPVQRNGKVPAELNRICQRMLAKLSSERYQSAHELLADLRAWQHDAARPVPEETPVFPPAKGLRTYDESDAPYFLKLLPGQRNREGLPASLAFWKKNLEAVGATAARAGLLLGASGSGKTSFLQAGLIPHLGPHVSVIDVECLPHQSVAILTDHIRRRFFDADDRRDLVRLLAELREGSRLRGKKLVLVLDQFEQWLAVDETRASDEAEGLIAALRQCDGQRLTALLAVRDDFALPATQFLERLEVPLDQRTNFGTLEQFSTEHAAQVLTGFGRQLGRLELADPLPAEQTEFLDAAVEALDRANRLSPVGLAILTQMLADEPWQGDTLQALGGVTGLEVAFLRAMIESDSAHPTVRAHQDEVERLLVALLPPAGSSLKGPPLLRSRLLAVCDMRDREANFDELVRVLDVDLRIVTPARPLDSNDDSAGEPCLRLTHDTLVPAIRGWMKSRRQRGWIATRLNRRTAEWQAQPRAATLPSWWETALLHVGTDAKRRTMAEGEMLRAARGKFVRQTAMVAVLLVGCCFAVGWAWKRWETEQARLAAQRHVAQLQTAAPAELPEIVQAVMRRPEYATSLLAELAESADNRVDRHRARLVLVAHRPRLLPEVLEKLVGSDLEIAEVLAATRVLQPYAKTELRALWNDLLHADQNVTRRFRAAIILARLDPRADFAASGSDAWRQVAPFITDQLLDQLTSEREAFELLVDDTFSAIRDPLLPSLQAIANDSGDPRMLLAISVITAYASGRPATLVELVVGGDSGRFAGHFAELAAHRDAAAGLLRHVLTEEPRTPAWPTVPGRAPFEKPQATDVERVIHAHGMLTEDSAFCLNLPFGELDGLTRSLGRAGYRPLRVRPFQADGELRVAVVWVRDGSDWTLQAGISLEAVDGTQADSPYYLTQAEVLDQQMQSRGYRIVDAAVYDSPDADNKLSRLLAVWQQVTTQDPETELFFCRGQEAWEAWQESVAKYSHEQMTHHVHAESDGSDLHTLVVRRGPPSDRLRLAESTFFSGTTGDLLRDPHPGRLLVDLHVSAASPLADLDTIHRARLAAVNTRLENYDHQPGRPVEPMWRYSRALCLYELARYAEALDTLNELIDDDLIGPYGWQFTKLRAQVHARLGNKESAATDLVTYLAKEQHVGRKVFAHAVVTGLLGDLATAQARAAQFADTARNAEQMYFATLIYARLALIASKSSHPSADDLLDRAFQSLEEAVARGYAVTERMWDESDLRILRETPRFAEILAESRAQDHYRGVWQIDSEFESRLVVGKSPTEQLAAARDLFRQGYRPRAVSVYRHANEAAAVTALVWHRPRIPEAEIQRVAERQAFAALGLLRLAPDEALWDLFAHTADPRLATAMMHAAASCGISSQTLADRLERESRPDVQYALILALGQYERTRLAPETIERIARLFDEHADAGVHGAAEWFLRRHALNVLESLATRHPPEDKAVFSGDSANGPGWYVNNQRQTFVTVHGPVQFQMGAPAHALRAASRVEAARHTRRIGRSFAVAACELTNREFEEFLKENEVARGYYLSHGEPPATYSSHPDAPACKLDLYLAALYCRWLTTRAGLPESEQCFDAPIFALTGWKVRLSAGYLVRRGYRLPTEAEWEFVARAGTTTRRAYGWDPDVLAKYEWFQPAGSLDFSPMHPVGRLLPNRFGMFDMLGNVGELTCNGDIASSRLRQSIVVQDAETPMLFEPPYRLVVRGATFADPAESQRSSYRMYWPAHFGSFRHGIRLARTLATE